MNLHVDGAICGGGCRDCGRPTPDNAEFCDSPECLADSRGEAVADATVAGGAE